MRGKTVRIEFEVSDKLARRIQQDIQWDIDHNSEPFADEVKQHNDRWWRYCLPGDEMAIDTYTKLKNLRIEIVEGEK